MRRKPVTCSGSILTTSGVQHSYIKRVKCQTAQGLKLSNATETEGVKILQSGFAGKLCLANDPAEDGNHRR